MEIKLINVRFLVGKRLAMTIMKTFIFLMCTTAFCLTPDNSFSQEKVIIEKDQLVTIDEVFKIIKKQTDFDFIYPRKLFKNKPKVELKKGEIAVSKLLEQSLSSNNLNFELAEDNTILIVEKPVIKEVKMVQQNVTGIVNDDNGQPIFGANVIVKGTTTGTNTDVNGQYSLPIPSNLKGNFTLVASYVGFLPQEKIISIDDQNELTINFELQTGLTLGEVIITANKRSRTIMETPSAVQAMSAQKLEQVGIRDLNEVMNFIPGASEGTSLSIGEKQYQLRGVPSIGGDATIGYYLDEASFNFYGSFYAPVSRAFDMERVEILRGPQSTLYGGGAMGGVIKFVPNKPNLKKFEGQAVVGGSTLKGGDPGYYGDLALNVPIIKDKLAFRLTGSYEEVGGYIESVDGQENIDGGNLSMTRGTLLYTPNENLKINLTYQNSGFKQFTGTNLRSIDPPVSNANPTDNVDANFNWYISTISYDFTNFATLTTTTSYIDMINETAISFDIPGLGNIAGDISTDTKALNHETRLASNTKSPFQWLAGGYYTNSEINLMGRWNLDFINSDNIQKSKAFSLFGEFSYDLFDGKLTPLFGIRSYTDTRSLDFGGNGGFQEEKFTSINPRFNLAFKPNKKQTYFLNIAKGFRSGVFNNPAWMQVHVDQNLPVTVAVDSDELWSYEIGTKQEMANNQILFELSAYFQSWKNMQNSIPDPIAGYYMVYGVGDVNIPGVDLAINYQPRKIKGLSLQIAANVNGAKYKKINPVLIPLVGQEDGERIQLVPAWNMGLNANYNWDLSKTNNWKANIMMAFTHTDGQLGFGGDESMGDNQDLLRTRLTVQNDKFAVSLFGNNILNENGTIFSQASALTLYTQTRPAVFGVELRMKF